MRFNNLTVARFIAAALVYIHHSSELQYTTGSHFLHTFAVNGFAGVSFFFVVSGFVLAASSLEKLQAFHAGEVASFYWKRVARIVPLWAVLSLPLVVAALNRSDPALWPFLTFTQAWYADVPIAYAILPVAWTLSVEMFFYVMFPLIAVVLRPFSGKNVGVVVIASGLTIPGIGALFYVLNPELAHVSWVDPAGPHHWLYTFPAARFGEFIAGIGIYLTISRQPRETTRLRAWMFFSASFAALVFVMGKLPIGGAWFVFPYAVLFTLLVLSLTRLEEAGVRVCAPWLLLLGEASFALYLVHQSYILQMMYSPTVHASGSPVLAKIFVFLVAVATSIGLFMLIETPARIALVKLLKLRAKR